MVRLQKGREDVQTAHIATSLPAGVQNMDVGQKLGVETLAQVYSLVRPCFFLLSGSTFFAFVRIGAASIVIEAVRNSIAPEKHPSGLQRSLGFAW